MAKIGSDLPHRFSGSIRPLCGAGSHPLPGRHDRHTIKTDVLPEAGLPSMQSGQLEGCSAWSECVREARDHRVVALARRSHCRQRARVAGVGHSVVEAQAVE